MNNMNPGSQRIIRLTRARMVAATIAGGVLLAGCSSSGGFDLSTAEYAPGDAGFGWSGDVAEESWASDTQGFDEDALGGLELRESRDMVITGELYMTVEDPVDVAREVTTIVQDAGGRIDARSQSAPDEYRGGSAHLTLRIPAPDLDAVVDKIGELGEVDDYRTSSLDVTDEVTDLEARISTLRASTARIESLLDEATNISDIIKLETELAERQGTLEGLEARQRGLTDRVSMSTIDLSLTTEPIVIYDEEPPSSFWDGLVSGWNGLVSFLNGALVVLGILLPWLALIALITVIVIIAVRSRRSRRVAPVHPPQATHSEPLPADQEPQSSAPTVDSAP